VLLFFAKIAKVWKYDGGNTQIVTRIVQKSLLTILCLTLYLYTTTSDHTPLIQHHVPPLPYPGPPSNICHLCHHLPSGRPVFWSTFYLVELALRPQIFGGRAASKCLRKTFNQKNLSAACEPP